jgi:predicted adenylyl cyclase CyaB
MIKEEIEMKAVLQNPNELRRSLRKNRARMVGKYKEINMAFDFPDSRLERNQNLLRLRRIGKRTIMTFKGRTKDGRAKVRDEFETDVMHFKAVLSILKGIGLVETFKLEKIREEYRLGKSTVVIDRLPKLGYFCEIETDSEREIDRVALRLGIKNLTNKSYNYFINDFIKRTNYKKKELVF